MLSQTFETISAWRTKASESDKLRTPWSLLRDCVQHYYVLHDKSKRARNKTQILPYISEMASRYLTALGYPEASPFTVPLDDNIAVFPFLEMKRANGAPLLWVLLSLDNEYENGGLMNGFCFDNTGISEQKSTVPVSAINNEELISKVFFNLTEPPRWLIFIGENSIVIVDRNKWNEKRYLEFDLDEIFSRREETTFQAMAVLLHRESLCPDEGESLLDKLDENSHKHASGVSQNLKYALRECIELLGNEVLYDMSHRLGRDLDAEPVDAAQLTLECLRYMYRMLFVLFIEARPELCYAPMKAQAYVQGYSLESLRDVADSIREETSTVGRRIFPP